MGGDGRNHVLIMRGIVADGGLGLDNLSAYPALGNSLAASIAVINSGPGADAVTLGSEVAALSSTYVLFLFAVAIALAAGVLVCEPNSSLRGGRTTWLTFVMSLAAALIVGSSFVVGFAIADGFFSTLGALVPAISALVITVHSVRSWFFSRIAISATVLAGATTALSWPLLGVLPFSALIALIMLGSRRRENLPRDFRSLWLRSFAAAVVVATVVMAVAVLWPRLSPVFTLSGATSKTEPWGLVILVLVAMAISLSASADSSRRRQFLAVALAGFGGLSVLLALLLASSTGFAWSYYAEKTHWGLLVALSWVLFAGAARLLNLGRLRLSNSRPTVVTSVVGALAVWLALASSTTAPEPVGGIISGTVGTRPDAVDVLLKADQTGEPFVLWDVSHPGSDRLASFWAVASLGGAELSYSGPMTPAVKYFWNWAYFADFSNVEELCNLLIEIPDLTVYTTNVSLTSEISRNCRDVESAVEIFE
jgi:hypothetical protein